MQTHEIEQGLSETVSLLDKLRMAIYRGEFPPGQRLVESELAEKYRYRAIDVNHQHCHITRATVDRT